MWWLLCIPFLSANLPDRQAQTDFETTRSVMLESQWKSRVSVRNLTPAAQTAARLIGVGETVAKLVNFKSTGQVNGAQAVLLRQHVVQSILRTLLEMRTVLSRIDTQMAEAEEERELLAAKRTRSVTMINITNLFIAGSLGATASALGFSHSTDIAQHILSASAAGNAVILSSIGVLKERGPRAFARSQKVNMLAKPLGFDVSNSAEDYPEVIWAYLNSPLPGDGTTRLNALMKRWRKERNFDGNNEERKAQLAGVATGFRLTEKLLDTRGDMLNELRTEVSKIEFELLEILTAASFDPDGN